jgi:ATP-dependent Zn protease
MIMKSKASRIFVFVLVIVAALIGALAVGNRIPVKTTYTDFLQQVQAGQVNNATIIAGNTGATQVTYKLKSGSRLETIAPRDYREALGAMQQKLVNIEIRDAAWQPLRMLANATPFFLLLGFWFYMMRKLKNGGGPRLFQG